MVDKCWHDVFIQGREMPEFGSFWIPVVLLIHLPHHGPHLSASSAHRG